MRYRHETHTTATVLPGIGRAVVVVFVLLSTLVTGIAISGCRQALSRDIHTAGDSFFPLAEGNRWIFAATGNHRQGVRDTVVIDAEETVGDITFFRLRASWPGFEDGLWVRRNQLGNLIWAKQPGGTGDDLLRFDAPIGARWGKSGLLHDCVESVAMYDNYAAVRTPYGLFDGARIFGYLPSCSDFGWGVSAARGVGPVVWQTVTIAGTNEWRLVSAEIHDDLAARPVAARIINGN
jgi:hypothetical protein